MSLQDFELLGKLGEGSFSSVFKVKRKADSEIYAMKQVKLGFLSVKEKENALNEIRILASLTHDNIIIETRADTINLASVLIDLVIFD